MDKVLRIAMVVAMVVVFFGNMTMPASAAAFTAASMSASGVGMPTNVGSTVMVSGGGMVPGAAKPITVYLAKSPGAKVWVTPSEDGDIVATTTSDNTGSWGTSFVVPERRSNSPVGGPVTNGVYDVFLQSGGDNFVFSGPTGMNVKPYVDRSTGSGRPGTEVTLKGTAFGQNETGITVVFDSPGIQKTVAAGVTANAYGSWTASFRVPDRAAAAGLLISVTGDRTMGVGTPIARTFEITRSLRLIPGSGSPGGTITASLRGFAASSAITFKIDAATLTTVPASPSSTADGRLVATFVIPPGTSYGPHKISATDAVFGTTAEQLMVTRATSVTLTPASGAPGDTITVSGAGFNPQILVDLDLGGYSLTATSGAVITGADGSFSASVKILAPTVPGYYPLAATDLFGESASAIFTILNPRTR